MPFSVRGSSSARSADNELYDRGCDLVETAVAIHRSVLDPAAAPAVPAVLGCLEATLNELGRACTTLQSTSRHWPAGTGDAGRRVLVERLEHGLTNLRVALEEAESASGAARSLAARRFATEDPERATR